MLFPNLRRPILLFFAFIMLVCAGYGAAQQPISTECTLEKPEYCIGKVITITETSGKTNTILVEAVTEDGIELRANNRFELANTPLELIIGSDINNHQPYIINRDFVADLQEGAGAASASWIDLLLIVAVIVLVVVIVYVLRRSSSSISPVALPPLAETFEVEPVLDWLAAHPIPACNQQQISREALAAFAVEEVDYLAIGGGLGSFTWVDHLRIGGVPADHIAVITVQPHAYDTFRRYCHNSQLFDSDRLRSDSGATPDNVWGWPGYAVREIDHLLQQGQVKSALGIAWQIFTEPTLAEPYTPRTGDVFQSVDREAERISWETMLRPGFAHTIRKTDDGRYAVAYVSPDPDAWQHKVIVTRSLHLAPGYAAPRTEEYAAHLDDEHLAARVVHAYQDHTYIYEHLAAHGGRVLLRGRGIAASQIIQRLADLRAQNDSICVQHILRTPIPAETERSQQPARRSIMRHRRLQPFNWPKSAFGGTWRTRWSQAGTAERTYIFKALGGTTTPARRLWQNTLDTGFREGWYEMHFGEIATVEPEDDYLAAYIRDPQGRNSQILSTDFIIDAIGLDARIDRHPLLKDLCEQYNLQLNPFGGLDVSENFEVKSLPNVFVAGVVATGNDYAPVDSFLGLQYVALRSVDTLINREAPGLQRLNGFNSLQAWRRWATGRKP